MDASIAFDLGWQLWELRRRGEEVEETVEDGAYLYVSMSMEKKIRRVLTLRKDFALP